LTVGIEEYDDRPKLDEHFEDLVHKFVLVYIYADQHF
jgi:hypothetical protein